MKKYLTYIKDNIVFIGLLFAPAALIAGLIDYRFHNYFWPKYNLFNLLNIENLRMFDFLSVFDFFIIILVFAYLINLFFSGRNKPDAEFRWIYIPIALLAVGSIFAKYTFEPIAPQIKSPGLHVLTNFISPAILFFILVFSLKDKKKLRLFETSLLFLFSVLGIFCIYEFFTDALPGANKDFLNRLVWPYIDPFFKMKPESANWLAYLFAPMAILSFIRLADFFRNKFKFTNTLFYSLAFIITSAVLILSKSYTGIIITFLILAFWIFIHLKRKWKIYFLIIVFIVSAAGTVSQYNTKKFQILLGNYKKANSIERRVQIYEFNIKTFLKKPFVGIGPGNYQSYFRETMLEKIGKNIPEEEIPPHAHNLIMHFWSELGIWGLLAILGIYLITIIKVISEPSKNAMYLVVLYFLGHGLIDVPYGLEETTSLFWIILALATSETSLENPQ